MQRKGLNYIHGIIAIILAVIALLFGGYILIPLFGRYGGLFVGVLIALIAFLFTLVTKTKLSEVFPFALPPVKKFFGSVLMYVGVTMFTSSISLIVGRFFDAYERSEAIDSLLLTMHPALAILVIAVLPAICEEFFCRGFLVKCFSGIKKEWVLIALVGAVFGALHLDVYTFVPTALFGALLCFIAIRTKSLVLPMFLHFANNALSVVITFSGARESAEEGADIFAMSWPQSIGMSILYIGLSILPFFIGYRMFTGKRVFVFKTFVALLVAVGVTVTGFVTFTLFSFRFVELKRETFTVSKESKVYEPDVDTVGQYELFVEIHATKPVYVTVIFGDTTVFKGTVSDSETIQKSIDYEGGDCKIIISPYENGEESVVTVTYFILESVLPQ